MTAAITAILTLLEQLLPAITGASDGALIDTVLKALIGMLPFIVQEVTDLVGPVKNIINALSENPATTSDQLSQLQALQAKVDAAFEAAMKDTDSGI